MIVDKFWEIQSLVDFWVWAVVCEQAAPGSCCQNSCEIYFFEDVGFDDLVFHEIRGRTCSIFG